MTKKEYIIYVLNKGLLAEPIEVKAKSPLEAVKKIYPTAKRDYAGVGHIVVSCKNGRGSWVYDTEKL